MDEEPTNRGKKLALLDVEVVATLVAFVAVVAVEAFPLRAPEKVVVVKVAVLGLNVSLVLDTFWGKLPDVDVTQVGYIVALVDVSSVMPTFVALVAVVAVEAFPLKAPAKVVVVSVLEEGLKESPVPINAV